MDTTDTTISTEDLAALHNEALTNAVTRRARILRDHAQGFLDDSEAYHDLCDLYVAYGPIFSNMPYPVQPTNRAKAIKR